MDLLVYSKLHPQGDLNAVTRKSENSKAQNRNKARNRKREGHESGSGTFICICSGRVGTTDLVIRQFKLENTEKACHIFKNKWDGDESGYKVTLPI